MYFVYVLLCVDGSLYTGSSNDVVSRFLVHLTGKGSKYTRSHKPLKIVYQEEFASKSEALKREIEIKKWNHDKKIKLLNLEL